ncbi:glycosyltransferase [Tengunoibacter tsumagoiensis]|uniref:Glycosyltransferase 2-like domain-containing protein n=1 Tax=Tengunoibacter tsumagoiensis TaxID=2014871 RepID=A0A402A0I0_9CHLR|nr:glycosyltransferase [Tengunoibacter tsumagoiensis]GCE12657.1 hypothetical protein KTT_25160 [Tengunoibacter tsumagoiensis]
MVDRTLEVSVIICAYTQERWTETVAAIRSVQQQTVPPCEIILVIDHNVELLACAQSQLPHEIIVIENSERKGLSGARNSGIAVSHGALIAFLDDDATAEPDWLERLQRCCEDPQVLGAGGVVEPLWLEQRPAWFPKEFYWVVGCTYEKPPRFPVAVRNPYGGCTCIRREVFETVGGFTDGIGRVGARPMGGEETELCIRAKQHWPQRHFLYDPHARIHHHIPAKRGKWSYFCSRCYSEGLSKATIAHVVGSKDSLASERAYTLKTLPLGVLNGCTDTLLRWDLSGILRAGAIIAGLAVTTTGYVVGTLRQSKDVVRRPVRVEATQLDPLSRVTH